MVSSFLLGIIPARAVIRDGGIDPANLGKGDWIYYMSMATNQLGGNVASVTNEHSLMRWYTNQGIRYIIVKAATSDYLFNGSYSKPQFTSNLVQIAHAHGVLIFGYNRSYGQNVPGEIQIADYVFQQGADGFVWDAESEWESNQTWIGTNGPALAWQMCSATRSNWPNKFLAHAPFDIVSYHSSFPYKEFGYWSDAVMPQIYHFARTGIKSRPSGNINWADANWKSWQNSLVGKSTNINGQTIYWTNAIKPLAPVNHVYGPNPPNTGVAEIPPSHVMEFVDCLLSDPNTVTAGGYKGASFWRADLHGAEQWANIKAATIGDFPGIVNNIVVDSPNAVTVGSWTSVRTFSNGTFTGDGSGTDTNSFGTNYLSKGRGSGAAYVEYRPRVVTAGDYDVFSWHPTRTNASASVPHVISHASGATTVYVNQTTNAGTWTLMGRFYFNTGTNTIRVYDNILEPFATVLTDGVKLQFVPPSTPPPAPSHLTATLAGETQINLTWRDNSTNEAAFVIARGTVNGGPYTDVASVGINITNYTDTNLSPATTYHYVVRASNAAGGSAPSAQASATTGQDRRIGVAVGDDAFGQSQVPATAADLVAIAAGNWHSLALRADGHVVAWGANWLGQCNVPASLTNAVAIAAGGYHGLAIDTRTRVIAWGDNDYGQCNVPAGLSNVLALAAGNWHSLALRTDRTVIAWGDNSFGQCNLPAGLSNVVAIAAAGHHSLALRQDGTVVAWGDNYDAQGGYVGQSIVPAGLANVVAIAAGEYHSLALRADGAVIGWGDNSSGQCTAPGGLTGVVALSAGGSHSLALRADGSVAAWGNNWHGQCSVAAIPGLKLAVAGGAYHSLVLLNDGVVRTPRFFNSRRQAGVFSGWIQALAGRSFALQYKTSLSDTTWQELPAQRGHGGLLLLQDTNANAPQRFYRVRQWTP